MTRHSLTAIALAAVSLTLVGCGDDVDSSTTTVPPVADGVETAGAIDPMSDKASFDRTRHIVLENPVSDGFKTVTALAHICETGDPDCPSGSEDVMILATYRFSPGRIYTHNPEMTLVPPDDCLRDDIDCRLSLSHCEYPDFSTQMEARHCVPPPSGDVSTSPSSNDPDQCNERSADYSHHVDFECLTGLSSIAEGVSE